MLLRLRSSRKNGVRASTIVSEVALQGHKESANGKDYETVFLLREQNLRKAWT
jgi:hypothetical protein